MVKTLTALAAAGVIATAAVSVPTKAEANPAWLVPVLIAGSVGAVALGAAANANANAYYAPAGTVYVQPRAQAVSSCHIVRERTAAGWRRIEVCN
jgi:hypothetical protein